MGTSGRDGAAKDAAAGGAPVGGGLPGEACVGDESSVPPRSRSRMGRQ